MEELRTKYNVPDSNILIHQDEYAAYPKPEGYELERWIEWSDGSWAVMCQSRTSVIEDIGDK